jgi:uncharacterized protein (DUF488 family)
MPKLYTLGHSNHSFEEFLGLLQRHRIKHVVDVRTIPKSRHVPWTNQKSLIKLLGNQAINYTSLPGLGGLRHPKSDSINTGWINPGFRGFADYMQTKEFYAELKKLNSLLKKGSCSVAIMCAEAVPWRCHRNLIADAEIIRGIKVFHIISTATAKLHKLTSFAIIDKTKRPMRISYPHSEPKQHT